MSVKYNIIQAGGTSTDINLSVEGMSLVLEMSFYKSGLHNITRIEDMKKEVIELIADANTDTKVSVYLLEDPDSNEGEFIVATCRNGLDAPYEVPNHKLIAFISEFIIPPNTTDLENCNITAIKVVG
jgi:hypothetical protein